MHYMKLNPIPFEQIKSGKKDIELRLFDEKRQNIQVGDNITFINIENNDIITAKCIGLHRAPSFKFLFEKIASNERMGFPFDMSLTEMCEKMREYYSADEEEKYGVLGIELYRG